MTSRQAKGSTKGGWRCPYCGRFKPKALKQAHLLAEDAIREYEAGLPFTDPAMLEELAELEADLGPRRRRKGR